MRFRHFLIVALVFWFSTGSAARAFDSKREGFVLGLGGGYSPMTDFVPKDKGYYFVSDVGYAPSENLLITIEANALAYPETGTTGPRNLRGLVGYYYFGNQGETWFSTAGGGILKFSGTTGPGFVVGGGYEFVSHAQVGAYFVFGRTASDTYEKNHAALQFAITGYLY